MQRVKALQKELSSLQSKAAAKVHAKQQILNRDSDMQNGQRDKGAGYWDKEHHDDAWVPVTDMFSKLEKRKKDWDEEEKQNQLDKRSDEFVDEDEFEAPVVKAGKGLCHICGACYILCIAQCRRSACLACAKQGDARANRRRPGWCASAIQGFRTVRGNCRARIVDDKRGLRVDERGGCNS